MDVTRPRRTRWGVPANWVCGGTDALFEQMIDLPSLESELAPIRKGSASESSGWTAQGSHHTAVRSSLPRVLFTLPVRNEVGRLIPNLQAVNTALERSGLNYTLSVAEDGSTDGTTEKLDEVRQLLPGVLIQEAEAPLGRGEALMRLWRSHEAEIYGFSDADLASGIPPILEAIHLVERHGGLVTGSRYVRGARVNRPPLRLFVSQCYNSLVRFGFGTQVRDHQCGLKVYSSSLVHDLLGRTSESSWFWDTESIVIARRLGYPVLEVPVDWTEQKNRSTPLLRLASDIYIHGTGILRLKSRLEGVQARAVSSASAVSAGTSAPLKE